MLTRRRGETVDLKVAGRVIATVKVLEFLPNDQVRLGFDADRTVSIERDNMKQGKGDGHGDEESTGN
jgi:sRNA-binding carbon storage regulator CsrA